MKNKDKILIGKNCGGNVSDLLEVKGSKGSIVGLLECIGKGKTFIQRPFYPKTLYSLFLTT